MAYRRTASVEARLAGTRRRLLDAGVDLLAQDGYNGLTVDALARAAGVATGTVYRHFSGKPALVTELFRELAATELAAVRRAAAGPRPAPDRLAAAVATFAARALAAPRVAFALLAEPADPAIDVARLAFRRAYAELFAGLIAEAVDAGELPPQDPAVSAAALVGAIGEALIVPLAAPPRVPAGSADRLIAELIGFCLRGAGGSGPHRESRLPA
ncbi:MAG TPA: TetR/AcrR family transcriptional regulator [Mycobacteriales bacterium]|nr:TetR/AcrR family transcriptional regulator [Mycobacteriales bacterium]